MRPRGSSLFAALVAVCFVHPALLTAVDMPAEIADAYAPEVDSSISDEFNAAALDSTKWAYRTKGGGFATGPEAVAFEREGADRFVSIKGNWAERTGSGIVTKTEAHFGFYSLRYRVRGLRLDAKTPWHPAVWMAAQNFATGEDRRSIVHSGKSVEIDFLEHYFFPTWNSHVIPWDRDLPKGTKPSSQRMMHNAEDIATDWQELGLEYHPNYFQLWRRQQGVWSRIGTRVDIVDEPVAEQAIHRAHSTPGYWILSNKDHFENTKKSWLLRDRKEGEYTDFLFDDSSLDIDFFRYYPAL